MFRATLVLFVAILFGQCERESIPETGPLLPINSTGLKDYSYYSYTEFRPWFMHQITLVDNTLAGESFPKFALVPMPNNMRNPFPLDPVVNFGRILFYDKNLSANGMVSCGSCHQQQKAFTDGHAFSIGFNNQVTDRSSMSLANMGFINNYQWGSAVDNLPELVLKPLTHPVEMGNPSMEAVVEKVKNLSYYTYYHEKAFGKADIQEKSIAWALAQFVASIYSANARFDKAQAEQFTSFTADEKLGMELFNGKALCNHCHQAPTFAAPDFVGGKYGSTNGAVDLATGKPLPPGNKKGMAHNGLRPLLESASTSMKIPTLRNIELTSPYMHDGSFKSLEEVIEAYNSDIQYHEMLDPILLSPGGNKIPIRLHLTVQEKKALKAFLLTLTDTEMLTAKRYSDPF
jgi:cytochrome c peroxidase